MSVTMGQVQVPSSVATTCFLIPPGHYNLTVYSNGTNPSVYLSTSSSAATTVSMATTVTPASVEGYQGEGGAALCMRIAQPLRQSLLITFSAKLSIKEVVVFLVSSSSVRTGMIDSPLMRLTLKVTAVHAGMRTAPLNHLSQHDTSLMATCISVTQSRSYATTR